MVATGWGSCCVPLDHAKGTSFDIRPSLLTVLASVLPMLFAGPPPPPNEGLLL